MADSAADARGGARKSPDGYRLTPYDPAFAHHMKTARGVMKRRRAVLRVLAK